MMFLFAVLAAVCLCVPVYGLAGTEPSDGFLFLLGEINGLKDKVHALECGQQQKDVRVPHSHTEPICESGRIHFTTDFSSRTVPFNKTFTRVPTLSYGIVLLDGASITRVRCDVSSVTETQFEARCNTWLDSSIYSIFMSWIAC